MRISRATEKDAKEILPVAVSSFLDAHGHSASQKEIEHYMNENFGVAKLETELANPNNIFFVTKKQREVLGYAKISLNTPNPNISEEKTTKLERLYIHKKAYGTGISKALLSHSIDFAKTHQQKIMWLHVWVENKRAISFYQKMGFTTVGHYEFKLSENHYNPNFVMSKTL